MAEDEDISGPYSAQRFVKFLNKASGSPFTAAAALRGLLLANSFVEINESEPWQLVPGGKYFFTRNQSAVVAFCVGSKYELGNGFTVVGAHTDSPALKLKPVSAMESAGCLTIGCETYGGGIWQSWLDRDLGVSGLVLVREKSGKLSPHLVSLKRPLMRVPSLAVHLEPRYAEGLPINKETDLRPLLATAASAAASAPVLTLSENLKKGGKPKHHPALLAALAAEISCDTDSIEGFDLRACDAQPATLSGVLSEFVSGQGIDDLNGAYCATTALIASSADLSDESHVRIAFLFDHEEVGSSSAQGADSPFVDTTLMRIMRGVVAGTGLVETGDLPNAPGYFSEMYYIAIRRSLLLSVDNAHAVHPNFPQKHEVNHGPVMNGGPVIKYNSNLRYATDAVGATYVLSLAKKAGVPVQEFVVRQDSPCGTTIGPIVTSKSGIRAVDLGNAQLSMHSIREICGASDIEHMITLLKTFFQDFSAALPDLPF